MTSAPALLIVHQGAMGDLVCIFPIIAALRRRFRPVGILCQGHLGRLAAAEGLVEVWFPIEAAWTASLFTARARPEACSRLAPFSHILCFSASEALAAALGGISGAMVCRIPPRPPASDRVHASDHARQRVLSCGWLSDTDAGDMADDPLGASCRAAGGPALALLHPGAGSPRKRWPLECFLSLAEHLRGRRRRSGFLIGPAEEDILPELERRGERVIRPMDAIELIARLRTAWAYVGNDSGVSHLAGWAGVPSVVIFGPSDPERWRPRGRCVEVVQAAPACAPCFEREDGGCTSVDCLDRIRIESVLQAFDRVVSSKVDRVGR
ncbi:MAG: glycosyltransferase family 9 protein [Desulfobacterales bacterium]